MHNAARFDSECPLMNATAKAVLTANDATPASAAVSPGQGVAIWILASLAISHMLNDMMQAVVMASYPMLKSSLALNFAQIGMITMTFQVTASVLQPMIGFYSDRKPKPYSLAFGMALLLCGLVLASMANHYAVLLAAAGLIGISSSVFHPESSRIARMASGGRHGLAQSLFQVGGNFGSSLGPVAAALIVVPFGQSSIAWFALLALLGMVILTGVGRWFIGQGGQNSKRMSRRSANAPVLTRKQVVWAFGILLMLMFSKFVYLAGFNSYYTFYLIDKFHVPTQQAQLYLFIFAFAAAAGTFLGGPIGDRISRKYVIWFSILGVLPFSLILPYANLFWTVALTIPIGLILASAFSVILVYAQEMMPGRVGTVAGLFFGLAFGVAGMAAAALGWVADATSIEFVYRVCAFLPAIGLLAAFLPDTRDPGPSKPAIPVPQAAE
jgi:FSR family fosmidomycin resistance protein-like MFS transporter